MILRYLDPEKRKLLDDMKVCQRNLGFDISRLIIQITALETQINKIKIGSRTTQLETFNRRCADLEVDNICIKHNIEYFKKQVEKSEKYTDKLSKLFKKTYKRCNKLDKKLRCFGNNFDTEAKTTVSLFTKQKNCILILKN